MPVPPQAQEGRTGGAACPQRGQGLLPPPSLHGAQWGPSTSPQLGGCGQAAPAAPVQSLRGTGAPVRASGHRAAPCGTALRHGLWGRGCHPATGSGCPGPPSCSGQGWPGGLMAVPPAAPLTSSRLFPSLLCTRHAPCEPFLRGIRTKGSWEYLSGTGETGGLLGGPSCPRPGQHQPGTAAVGIASVGTATVVVFPRGHFCRGLRGTLCRGRHRRLIATAGIPALGVAPPPQALSPWALSLWCPHHGQLCTGQGGLPVTPWGWGCPRGTPCQATRHCQCLAARKGPQGPCCAHAWCLAGLWLRPTRHHGTAGCPQHC